MESKYAGPVATGLDTSQKREKPQQPAGIISTVTSL